MTGMDYMNRLANECLDLIFQSIDDCDTLEFQPYRPIIARVSPSWNEFMRRINDYYVTNSHQSLLLLKMFQLDPDRALDARYLSISQSIEESPAMNQDVLQELIFQVPNLVEFRLNLATKDDASPLDLSSGLRSLSKLESFTVDEAGGIPLDYAS
jgi:hypothetical protein